MPHHARLAVAGSSTVWRRMACRQHIILNQMPSRAVRGYVQCINIMEFAILVTLASHDSIPVVSKQGSPPQGNDRQPASTGVRMRVTNRSHQLKCLDGDVHTTCDVLRGTVEHTAPYPCSNFTSHTALRPRSLAASTPLCIIYSHSPYPPPHPADPTSPSPTPSLFLAMSSLWRYSSSWPPPATSTSPETPST